MQDQVFRKGFPKGFHMVWRDDCTLLVMEGTGFSLSRALCVAPRLQQGEAWLETAQLLAVGYAGLIKEHFAIRDALYCDRCGTGPRVDDLGEEENTSRAHKTWECLDCGHMNQRPRS